MNRPDEAKITSTFSTVGDTRRETAVGAGTGSLTAFMDNGDLERDESAETGGAAALPLHRGTHTHLGAETCKENLRSLSQNMPAANDRLQLRLAKIEHDNSTCPDCWLPPASPRCSSTRTAESVVIRWRSGACLHSPMQLSDDR